MLSFINSGFLKRFPEEILKQINERMVERAIASGKQNKEDDNNAIWAESANKPKRFHFQT